MMERKRKKTQKKKISLPLSTTRMLQVQVKLTKLQNLKLSTSKKELILNIASHYVILKGTIYGFSSPLTLIEAVESMYSEI